MEQSTNDNTIVTKFNELQFMQKRLNLHCYIKESLINTCLPAGSFVIILGRGIDNVLTNPYRVAIELIVYFAFLMLIRLFFSYKVKAYNIKIETMINTID